VSFPVFATLALSLALRKPVPQLRSLAKSLTVLGASRYLAHSRQQPLKEINSPRAEGNVGVKGAKANDFEVSNPAAAAALTVAEV
jgi:hypothetical protein